MFLAFSFVPIHPTQPLPFQLLENKPLVMQSSCQERQETTHQDIEVQRKGIQINLTVEQLLKAGYTNNKTAWSEEEDALLLSLAKKNKLSWKEIAEKIERRTAKMCYSRYRRLINPLKEQWTEAENQKLLGLIQHKGQQWTIISQHFKSRTPKQLKDHFHNYLVEKPNKNPWTLEEDIKLIDLLKKYGADWDIITNKMGGRIRHQIKNRYYGHLKRMQQKKKEDQSMKKEQSH